MNRAELIDLVADQADISKSAAGRALDAALEAIAGSLADGEPVTLIGFGTFAVRERPSRMGRNPRTGEQMEIAAAKIAAFKPGKALKDRLN